MCALKNAARLLVDRHGQVQREAGEEREKHLSRVSTENYWRSHRRRRKEEKNQ